MVRLHGAHLMAVARQYLPQDADAEDAVQEALLKAFTCFHQFKEESRLSTWLHRIVVNAALMNRRSRSRKREQLVGHDEMVGAVAVRASSDREDPSERVMHSPIQDARLVAEHMQQLPGCHRTVMELRLIQHRSNADAARELGVTPAALKTMLHRAKSRIHKSLAQDARLAHLIA
jgi:RNA polymerase sigma-70 factor (ECF subfamily)